MGSLPDTPAFDPSALEGETTDTERAVLGLGSVAETARFLSGYAQSRLGSAIAGVRFRAGRIDAVWGVVLDDGREVVIKCHRPPVDLEALTAARDAKSLLRGVGYPCPEPMSGPDEVDDRVLSVESLLGDGSTPNGRDRDNRRLLATGLARHIDVLRGHADLIPRAGPGPSWCQYQDGPWPTPHDSIVDFRTTPVGYRWLDAYGQEAAAQILSCRDDARVVVGHADWYAGNVSVAGGALVATFDWELVADAEAVIAGFTAACYASSATSGGGLSTPEEVVSFLLDYDSARDLPLNGREQRAAAGAAAWILAFNARWELAMRGLGQPEGATLALVRERRADYLSLAW